MPSEQPDDLTIQQSLALEDPDPMLKWFEEGPFLKLAQILNTNVPPGPERTIALRKLLEARDAAVRAVIYTGG